MYVLGSIMMLRVNLGLKHYLGTHKRLISAYHFVDPTEQRFSSFFDEKSKGVPQA